MKKDTKDKSDIEDINIVRIFFVSILLYTNCNIVYACLATRLKACNFCIVITTCNRVEASNEA